MDSIMEIENEFINKTEEIVEELLQGSTGRYEQTDSYDNTEDDNTTTVFLELYTVISIFCIVANIVICYAITRFKRLRQEKSKYLILNWAIVNTLYLLISPIIFRLYRDYWHVVIGSTTMCITEEISYSLILSDILFISALTVYWFIKLYNPNSYVKLEKHMAFLIIHIYVFSAFCLCLNLDACFQNSYNTLAAIMMALCIVVFFLLMVVLNIIHAIRKRKLTNYSNKNNLPFLLSNTFFLSCLPFLTSMLIVHIFQSASISLLFATLLLTALNPIYFFVILFVFDKDFSVCIKHVLSNRCATYNTLEDDEHPIVFNNESNNIVES